MYGFFKLYRQRLLFEVFVSDETCDISEDIVVDGNISGRSPCRNYAVICSVRKLNFVSESVQDILDFRSFDHFTEPCVEEILRDIDDLILCLHRIVVCEGRDHAVRIYLFEQRECHCNSEISSLSVNALLISERRIGLFIEVGRCTSDSRSREHCAFEYDRIRGIQNGIILAALDACKIQRLLCITDDKMVMCKLQILLIQKKQLFAVFSKSDNDLFPVYMSAVICMLR